jgi:hypothetical protein
MQNLGPKPRRLLAMDAGAWKARGPMFIRDALFREPRGYSLGRRLVISCPASAFLTPRLTLSRPVRGRSPRKGEALERGYLKGRYGAVPLVSDLRN